MTLHKMKTDLLVPYNQHVPASELRGDLTVLEHPIITQAFESVLQLHKPRSKIALFTQCTATRPYSSAEKYKHFIDRFSDRVDIIVVSNGGIIPLRFEKQYPYMDYNAHKSMKPTATPIEYQNIVGGRIKRFLNKHRYEYALFAALPSDRIRKGITSICNNLNLSEYAIVPSNKQLEEWKSWRNNAHKQRYPFSYTIPLDAIEEQLIKWSL